MGSLIIFVVFFLPLNTQSEEVPARGPIPFASYDLDSNNFISEEEFDSARAKRMAQRATEGRPMRGAANAPVFSELDKNNDGQLTRDELMAGQKAQMEKRQKMGMGQGRGMGRNMPLIGNDTKASSGNDTRQLISIPERARELMRKDMLNNLSVLGEITGYLAENNFDAASDISETGIGRSSMGKHRGTGAAPGWYISNEMRKIGWAMHDAASEFSIVAKKGDMKSSMKALEKLIRTCVACHNSYRTR